MVTNFVSSVHTKFDINIGLRYSHRHQVTSYQTPNTWELGYLYHHLRIEITVVTNDLAAVMWGNIVMFWPPLSYSGNDASTHWSPLLHDDGAAAES